MQQLGSLTQPGQFQRALREGRRSSLPGVVAYVSPSSAGLRLGLSVRASGAVQRNRVKRRLREAFRIAAPLAPAGADIVVRADERASVTPFQELEELARRAVGGEAS